MFHVILLCWCSWSLTVVFGLESVSVTEGESVTLYMNITEQQRKDGISWKFGANINIDTSLIAEIKRGNNEIKLYNDRPDERFNNRLNLDQTGSLTIKNITVTHSGLYQITTSRYKTLLNKTFNITVYTHLPVPVTSRGSSQCSSSLYCSVLCSVMNVSHDVSLSWYKGKSLLSSISVSDLNIRLSLPLEVEYQDNNTYRCVINNPITNHTQHLNINELCQPCSVFNICKCGFTEAVIRLVVSGLVGVAVVALILSDVRSRGDEQMRRSDTQLND